LTEDEEEICLDYDEEEEEARCESDRREQDHWEQAMVEHEMEQAMEEEGLRILRWKEKADEFRRPIKVEFT
jgi:hypothetical protein